MGVRVMEGRQSLRILLPVVLCLLGAPGPQRAVGEVYWAEAPELAPPATGQPPEFGDLDGDSDYDLVYGAVLQSYRNVGTLSLPSWQQDNSLVEGVEYLVCMTVCLADLDADGDLDLSAGLLNGEGFPLWYWENVGTAGDPVWQMQNAMYGDLPPGICTCPELADLDDDGDLDLVLALYGNLVAYRNTGTADLPSWTPDDSLVDGVSWAYLEIDPNLGDLDSDGDLDMVLGSRWGDSPIMCFENTGTAQEPAWIESEDLLTGVDRFVGTWGLDLADIDGDGDVDLLALVNSVGPVVYLNCGPITPMEPSTWGRIKAVFK
jgi:hypothetical protein